MKCYNCRFYEKPDICVRVSRRKILPEGGCHFHKYDEDRPNVCANCIHYNRIDCICWFNEDFKVPTKNCNFWNTCKEDDNFYLN